MFEGVLTNPTQPNALYLNVGSGSSDYINADISTLTAAWSGNIKKIWLEFTGSGNLSSNVRIGWVKLTE